MQLLGFAEAHYFRQLPARPVSGTITGFLLCLPRDPGLHFRIGYARLAAFVSWIESGDAFLLKPPLPSRNRRRCGLQRGHDLTVCLSVC